MGGRIHDVDDTNATAIEIEEARCLNAYDGLRSNGAGCHASSATILPPSFVDVAARGEWSIGEVLDVYFSKMGGEQWSIGKIHDV